MNVLYIAKNIPLPDYKENNIILDQKKLFDGGKEGIEISVMYPKEYTPKFLSFLGGRFLANSKLKNTFSVDGVKVLVLPYFRLPIIKAVEWVLCFISRKKINFNYDLIHCHYIFPDGILGYCLSKKYDVPFVVTVRSGDFINVKKSFINKLIFKFILNKADKIIALTQVLKNDLLDFVSEVKITTIPNFIDDDFYHIETNKISDYPSKKLQFISVANLIPRKNIEWLIEYASKNVNSIDLIICGNGELLSQLKLKATNNVYFKGRIEREAIIEELDKADVFVLPSVNETFGLVYVEAAARKNVIVGLSGTGLDGVMEQGGYFVKDKQDLFCRLDMLIAIDHELLADKKNKAFFVAKKFKKSSVKSMLNKLYLEVVND